MMQANLTKKEKAIACKTLIGFLYCLVDERIVVELRNDLQLSGKLISVDSQMNLQLQEVTIKTPLDFFFQTFTEQSLNFMFVKGVKIRYVRFDDKVEAPIQLEQLITKIRTGVREAHRRPGLVSQSWASSLNSSKNEFKEPKPSTSN